jgi:hypothetical protein
MMMRSAIAAAVFGAIAGSGLAGDVLVAMAQTSSSAAPSLGKHFRRFSAVGCSCSNSPVQASADFRAKNDALNNRLADQESPFRNSEDA